MVVTDYHPDLYWIRRAFLMALLTHPYVRETKVAYPNIGGEPLPPVAIERGRLFGGPELIEPGLTLAVYPFHSDYDPMKGYPSSASSNDMSVIYPVQNTKHSRYSTLAGHTGEKEFGVHASIKLMVQLYFRDAIYNAPVNLSADYVAPEKIMHPEYYGYNFQYADDTPPHVSALSEKSKYMTDSKTVEVQVLPGEEILTQWTDIVKFAIRDIKVLRPFYGIRNPIILCSDYPTSTWTTKSSNLVFHSTYHVVQFDVVEPPIPPYNEIPLIQSINIES